MQQLKFAGGLALVVLSAFALDGCLRRTPTLQPNPSDGIDAPPPVSVGITAGQGVTELTLEGAAEVHPSRRRVSGTISVRINGGMVTVAGRDESPPVRIMPGDEPMAFNGRRYRGFFEVRIRNGALCLINVVPADDYLAGVVGKEMNLSWPEAALKAQVIASRTYGLYAVARSGLREKGFPFDVFDDERSQVYGGMERENADARRLVKETGGMVLRWNGELIKAFYSSTCGGATDPADVVLRHPRRIPPLQGTVCGYCTGSKYYTWTLPPMPVAELSQRIGERIGGGTVVSVAPKQRLPSGRVATIEVRTDRGTFTLDANDEFRRKIDPRKIRSTLWDEVAVRDGKLHLSGRGWGHGAGMCQMGALGMAREGFTAAKILAHYYPGAALEKIY